MVLQAKRREFCSWDSMARDRLLFLLSAKQFYGGKSTNGGRGQAVMSLVKRGIWDT